MQSSSKSSHKISLSSAQFILQMRNWLWRCSDPSDSINKPLTQVSWRSGSQIFMRLNIKGSGARVGLGWRLPWYCCLSNGGTGCSPPGCLPVWPCRWTCLLGPTAGLLSPRNWHGPHRLSEGFPRHLHGPCSCGAQVSLSRNSRNSFHLTDMRLQKLLRQNRE